MDDLTRQLLANARDAATVHVGGDVPADVLLSALLGETHERVHPRGVRLSGAWIVGQMDWEWQRLTAPLK